MRFKVFDKLSVVIDEKSYTHTIDIEEGQYSHKLGLIELCGINKTDVRETLDYIEGKNAIVSSYTGTIFFKSKIMAKKFIEELENRIKHM